MSLFESGHVHGPAAGSASADPTAGLFLPPFDGAAAARALCAVPVSSPRGLLPGLPLPPHPGIWKEALASALAAHLAWPSLPSASAAAAAPLTIPLPTDAPAAQAGTAWHCGWPSASMFSPHSLVYVAVPLPQQPPKPESPRAASPGAGAAVQPRPAPPPAPLLAASFKRKLEMSGGGEGGLLLPSWLRRPGEEQAAAEARLERRGPASTGRFLPPVGLRRPSAGLVPSVEGAGVFGPERPEAGPGSPAVEAVVPELQPKPEPAAEAPAPAPPPGPARSRPRRIACRPPPSAARGDDRDEVDLSSDDDDECPSASASAAPYRRRNSATLAIPPSAARVTKEDLVALFDIPVQEVSQRLGLCATVLKKLCRSHGISRWPQRKLRSLARWVEIGETVLAHSVPGFDHEAIARTVELLRETREEVVQNPSAPIKAVTNMIRKLLAGPIHSRLQLADADGGDGPAARGRPVPSAAQLHLDDITTYLSSYLSSQAAYKW